MTPSHLCAVGSPSLKLPKDVFACLVLGERSIPIGVGLGMLGQHASEFGGDVSVCRRQKAENN